MINAKEIRIGNLVEYRITDKLDERKEWWEVSEIDADDIHWLSKVDTKDEDFRAIPLTEEWLLKFGFKKYSKNFIKDGNIEFYIWTIDNSYQIKALDILIKIQTVHELQNLFFLLTKTELFYE